MENQGCNSTEKDCIRLSFCSEVIYVSGACCFNLSCIPQRELSFLHVELPSRVWEAEYRETKEAATLLELLPVSARAAATEERSAAASAARQQAEAAEAARARRAAAAATIPVVLAVQAAAKSISLGVGQLLQGMIVKSEPVVSTRGHCMHRSNTSQMKYQTPFRFPSRS